ncbi:MAG: FAD-binding oxidoreductase [Chitinophagaceae bacterium]|nr:FAD-binding oxidoreductase [Chitinophagaceae bacterium]
MQRKDFLKTVLLANAALATKPLAAMLSQFCEVDAMHSNDNVTYYKKTDAKYNDLRKGFNKRIDKFPQIIAVCKTTAGVAEAVNYAIANKLPVAVKSGGHCMEGFSCNNGGMVINLSELSSIEWTDDYTIKVGPGCKLANLYNELLPKQKIIPGGSCAGVAIGGLVVGGGYGLMSRLFGLTCDSLLDVTMVDGMGNIVTSVNNNDLLWACKGGGSGNFGIVTELKFKVHKAPKTMQSIRFKTRNATAQKAKEIFKVWFQETKQLPNHCFSACLLNGKTVYVLLTNTSKNTPAVQNFITKLSAISQTTTKTAAQPLATALKTYYGRQFPMNFKNASAGLYKSFDEIEPFIEEVLQKVINTPGMIYQVNTVGGYVQNADLEKQSSFPHRAFTYFSELQTYWETSLQSKKAMEKFEEIQQLFSSNNISVQYRNYPDINFKNSLQLYYGNNLPKLQAIKKLYDPNNVIRHEQSIL